MSQSVCPAVTQSVNQTRKMDWKANTNIIVAGKEERKGKKRL